MLKEIEKEFKLELRYINNRKYIRVINKVTKKVGFIYNNSNKVQFLGHINFNEVSGRELINLLENR